MIDLNDATQRRGDETRSVLKAVVDERGRAIAAVGLGEGVIEPPYDPAALCLLLEHSNSLRPNIDAYATNIDGFGHKLEAAIDFDADDADQRVAESIFLERVAARERTELDDDASLEPTDDEIAARRKELGRLARVERARLQSFFESCTFDHSFVDLRRMTRQDLEVTGNAYWECLRDARGRLARLVYVPSHTVRLLPLDRDPTDVEDRVRVSPVSLQPMQVRRRLRRFVQIEGDARVYFKSFGDPRVISRKTGAAFESVEALKRADLTDGPATELLHFAIHSSRSPYGVPRWIGTLLSVLGSRSMEEVNHSYFDNKSVPPLAVLVSGGTLSPTSIPRIESHIEENIKGKDNFHKILIIEAEPSKKGDGSRTRVDIKPLTSAQQQDALFQDYDSRNIDKVGSSFRVPALLRGDSKDFNRSVADAQLIFAEDQVFAPERDSFDHVMNRRILADMGIRFWSFRSQTPVTRDPERLTVSIEKLVRVGVLTPEEGRALAEDVFNTELRKLPDEWVKQPITLTLASIQTGLRDAEREGPGLGAADEPAPASDAGAASAGRPRAQPPVSP